MGFLKKNKILLLVILAAVVILAIAGLFIWQKTKIPKDLVAVINGEKIYKPEYEDARKIISWSENTTEEAQLKKAAIDHVIEKRLLAKEAQKQGLDKKEELNNLFSQRVETSMNFFGSKEGLISYLKISDYKNYEDYLRNIIYKDYFSENIIWWKKVNFLSVRFSWNDPMSAEEAEYRKVADEKIAEYYQKLIDEGLTFQEIVKQRCNDPEINYRPMSGGGKTVIYKPDDKTLLQPDVYLGSCLEQGLDIKITKENPGWLDLQFLAEVKKLKKSEVSNIFALKTAGGDPFAYIFIQVADESPFPYASADEMISALKNEAKVKIYEKNI